MQRDLIMGHPPKSSFLSCEKDIETILRKIFIESQPYSNELKKYLIIQQKDCIVPETQERKELYDSIVKDYSLARLIKDGYVILVPKQNLSEFDTSKSYIIISIDNFTLNEHNPEFRDCTVFIDIICPLEAWDIGNYALRPLKIAGYIDGILNGNRLSGIGEFHFMTSKEHFYDETWGGYSLAYRAIHMTDGDDKIPPQ